jgi:hypothetical protein
MPTIKLTGLKGGSVRLDARDHARFRNQKWNHGGHGYAVRYREHAPRCVPLHRAIMGFPKAEVRFKNGDKLDCRRRNLIVVRVPTRRPYPTARLRKRAGRK